MADVKIRNLPDWVVASFKSSAEHAGHSLEQELRSLLTERASKAQDDLVKETIAFNKMLERKYGLLSDSTEGIRKDRQARG